MGEFGEGEVGEGGGGEGEGGERNNRIIIKSRVCIPVWCVCTVNISSKETSGVCGHKMAQTNNAHTPQEVGLGDPGVAQYHCCTCDGYSQQYCASVNPGEETLRGGVQCMYVDT